MAPESGEITPADPPVGRPVPVGCDNAGLVSGEGSSDDTDWAGSGRTAAEEGISVVEDGLGRPAGSDPVGDTATMVESEFVGAEVADTVDVGLDAADSAEGVSAASGTGAGTAAAGTCGEILAAGVGCAAMEETALVVPVAVETASDEAVLDGASLETGGGGGEDGGA